MIMRDKEKTKERILGAVGRLLAEKGFGDLGINAVAREAGVDKVLIYRYFGGMKELLRAFSHSGVFWPTFEEVTGGDLAALKARPLEERVRSVALNFAKALRNRPLTQEILAWETVERSHLNSILVKVRKELSERLFREPGLVPAESKADVMAITTLIAAGINYLILRGRLDGDFNGMDIRSDVGWKRIEAAVGAICDKCLKSGASHHAFRMS